MRAQIPKANPDPCTQLASIPPSITTDEMHKREIKVPVLSIFGDAEAAVDAFLDKYSG